EAIVRTHVLSQPEKAVRRNIREPADVVRHIEQSESGSDDSLVRDRISNPYTRAELMPIGVPYIFCAQPAGTRTVEYECSRPVAGAGIGRVEVDKGHSPRDFIERHANVPAQPEIESQPVSDFPAILCVSAPVRSSVARD